MFCYLYVGTHEVHALPANLFKNVAELYNGKRVSVFVQNQVIHLLAMLYIKAGNLYCHQMLLCLLMAYVEHCDTKAPHSVYWNRFLGFSDTINKSGGLQL